MSRKSQRLFDIIDRRIVGQDTQWSEPSSAAIDNSDYVKIKRL